MVTVWGFDDVMREAGTAADGVSGSWELPLERQRPGMYTRQVSMTSRSEQTNPICTLHSRCLLDVLP